MIQVWTINILIIPSPGRTEKSKNGQKNHRTKASKDQNQGRQNPLKWENILRLQQSRCTIPWSHDTGVDNQHSRHAITWQRKANMDKSTTEQKPAKDQNQGLQKPQKWENILRLQQSRCTIPWSHDTGVDNQHSCHAITWPHREKQKWTKAPPDKSPKGSESRETNPPKMRKYFKTPTIKVYDPMITWYICGQSTFSSCYHVAAQKKTKMDKSTTGRKPQKIRIKADKTPKNEKIFYDSNNQGVQSHNHMIQVWTINILVMPSSGRTEKSKNGQKHHRKKAPKGSESRQTKPPKMWKYFKTPRIKVYDPMITWYRCGQSTFSSYHHVAAQRKAKMDKKTTGQKPQRIRIKADKTR